MEDTVEMTVAEAAYASLPDVEPADAAPAAPPPPAGEADDDDGDDDDDGEEEVVEEPVEPKVLLSRWPPVMPRLPTSPHRDVTPIAMTSFSLVFSIY